MIRKLLVVHPQSRILDALVPPTYAPQVTVTSINMGAIISWTAVAGASNYQVYRTEGVKECKQGKVLLATTTSRSFTDSGLMNGRNYYYIVIPKGPNASCFGLSSRYTMIQPSKVPSPTTLSPTRKPSPPTKFPTSAPTRRCGNGYCEIDEYFATCPVDCLNRQIDSLDEAPKGAPGIMFTIESKFSDVSVSSFEFYTWEGN